MNLLRRSQLPQQNRLDDEADVFDRDNLASRCREFYEKRLRTAEAAFDRWNGNSSTSGCCSDDVDSTISSSSSSSSSNYFSSSVSHLPRSNASVASSCGDANSLLSSDANGKEKKEQSPSSSLSDDPNVVQRLPAKLHRLRQEMLSLLHMDKQLFEHLSAIRDEVEQLKEQRLAASAAAAASSNNFDVVHFRLGSYDRRQAMTASEPVDPFASLPNQSSYVRQKQQLLSQQSGPGDKLKNGLKSMLRSGSFLAKPRTSLMTMAAAARKKRGVATRIPVRIVADDSGRAPEENHQTLSLPFIMESLEIEEPKPSRAGRGGGRGHRRQAPFRLPLYHKSLSKRLNDSQKMSEYDDEAEADSTLQNSTDSGIHHGSDDATMSLSDNEYA